MDRTTRGGSHLNGVSSSFLRNDVRASDTVTATRSFVGFRLAQSIMAQPIGVPESTNFLTAGLAGGPFTPIEMVYTISLPSTGACTS